ncbi:PRAME family member 12-like [Chionomys nivalis]|uniref:PRAME family member 12-like n=1 Tax=Chionomys nivalis TaxID=269649 RepID=UPI002594509C|nr:PRAME family member 12-like [Chionomys nivalis]
MSLKAPPTILELAVKNLLGNQDFTISVLQEMPTEFFPSLFKEAFNRRCMRILPALVSSWPFACLPVGAMMKVPDVMILQAVLAGIDMLLTQKVHLRSSKLQVLDLRNEHNRFWDVWAGLEGLACSKGMLSEEQKCKGLPRYALRQPLKVVTDFELKAELDEQQAYLLQWAQQQKRSVKLYCMKMTICETSVELIKAVLKTFPQDSVEELELSRNWSLATLSRFAPCLGQMRNLHKLHLDRIDMYTDIGTNPLTDREEKRESKFMSKIFKLNCLRHLSMNYIFFSGQLLKHLCRSMMCPVESLSIQGCLLSEPDLEHLCLWPRLYQLKHLKLHGLSLLNLSPTHLQFLLEKVSDSLQTLELQHCLISDSQLRALLPALSKCSKLNRVNFFDNDISTSLLKDLLHCMANLSTLTEEFYPAPLECYDQGGLVLLMDRFANLCPDLLNILRSKRHPKKGSFGTTFCHKCLRRCIYDLRTGFCPCHKKR